MRYFPDETAMERSEDGSEPIRGGSIGLNRILNGLVDIAGTDTRPRFSAVLISAFTIFRNVWTMQNNPTAQSLEEGFVTDVNLFLDYFDTYLSHTWNNLPDDKYCPVIIYFPEYHHLPKEIAKEQTGKKELLEKLYKAFLSKHGSYNGEVKRLERCRCFWVKVGDYTYPHKEVVNKFRDISGHHGSIYTSGDPICLISHIPLDWFMSARLRNLTLLESYTGRIRPPSEFRLKIDKDGRVPFHSATMAVLGDDSVMIKGLASLKQRREILEAAEKDRWLTRSEDDVRTRLSKLTGIPVSTLGRYNFV